MQQHPGEEQQHLRQRLSENEAHIQALQEQLESTQRLAMLGTMAALAGHEFNNILVPMISYAEFALKHENDTQLMRKALQKVMTHGARASLFIESMLGMVRSSVGTIEDVPVQEAVDEAFDCLIRDLSRDQIAVDVEVVPGATVRVIRAQLQQVLLNLILNARHAMLEEGGTLTIRGEHDGTQTVTLTIEDTGCGMDQATCDRVFEPFFTYRRSTNKGEVQGTGLGMCICKDIIESYGGTIRLESALGKGTTVTVTLPCTTADSADDGQGQRP